MADQTQTASSRIAIKFGGPRQPSKTASQPNSHGKRARTFDDSDDDGSEENNGWHEAITGFGDGGAEMETRERQSARKSARSEAKHSYQPGDVGEDRTILGEEERPMQWGLNIKQPGLGPGETSSQTSNNRSRHSPQPDGKNDESKPQEQSIDEAAFSSLLGNVAEPFSKRKLTVKPVALDTQDDVSTLKEYEDNPVEGFGVALLRGLGWDGKDRGPQIKEPKRREAHLALGAKKLKEPEDLCQWEHSKNRLRLDEYRREEARRKEARDKRGSYRLESNRRNSLRNDRYVYSGGEGSRDCQRDHDHDRDHYRDRDRDRDRGRDCKRRYRDSGRHSHDPR